MGVNWAAGLIRWKPHIDSNGCIHSLSHLHPFRFVCEVRASRGHPPRTVTINVGFGLHVFTCSLANAGADADEYRDDRERRAFDYERYCASLQLRELIQGLERRKCFFAKHENFFTVELDGAPAGHEYRVFFTVGRDSVDADAVTLIVQSAYFARTEWSPQYAPRKPIRFPIILTNILLGKPLRKPPWKNQAPTGRGLLVQSLFFIPHQVRTSYEAGERRVWLLRSGVTLGGR